MKLVLSHLGVAAIILSIPLSWWLVARVRSDRQVRMVENHRATVDILSAGTGFSMPPGGGGTG